MSGSRLHRVMVCARSDIRADGLRDGTIGPTHEVERRGAIAVVHHPRPNVDAAPERARGGIVSALALLLLLLPAELVQPTAAGADPVVTAAGDIASPGEPSRAQRRTARLIRRIEPRVALTLGDNQYPDGELRDFRSSYDPTWGRFLRITRPVPGNHDYHVTGADGYFDYFGRRARRNSGGYYSYDVGAWHLVAVNTGPGAPSGAQLRWIRRDLRRNRDRCELAYWHHPRWSSGSVHGSARNLAELWTMLYRAGVDVVLNGHEHNYERFAPLTPGGRLAPRSGVREIVAGTGGAGTYPFGKPIRGSQVRITGVRGVLRLALHAQAYGWRFIGIGGKVLDRGRHPCHA